MNNTAIDNARWESYLRTRMGDVRIERIIRSFPGFSRETWLVWLTNGEGVVLRVEPPGGGLVPTEFELEWKVYVALGKTNVPVAPALWFDAAPEPTDGRPLFVRRLVEGNTYLPGLYDDTPDAANRRRGVALEHAEKLALLHSMDWQKAGFGEFLPVPASARHALRFEVEHWRDVFHERKTAPFPIIGEALGWFETHLPPEGGAALSLCKGNNGIGEEIWRDDKIVAFSDWELASIGDPGGDWALSQGMLELWDRPKILAHYEDLTGFTLSAENFAFYRVWDIFKSACVLNAGLGAFLRGDNNALARATLGFGKVKVFENLLSQVLTMDLEEAAGFVVKWRKNPYHDSAISGA